jgi:hypothetical protein
MKNLNRILMLTSLISILSACNFSQTNPIIKKETVSIPVNKSIDDSKSGVEGSIEVNEITGCMPQKIYKGETIKLSFEKNHGENFAIISEKTKDYYFLTYDDSSYFPIMPSDKFKELLTLELKTSKVRSMSDKTYNGVSFKSKLFFTQTSWYWVLISHQGLDVDFEDAINRSTGRCRIYYVNKKRPKRK